MAPLVFSYTGNSCVFTGRVVWGCKLAAGGGHPQGRIWDIPGGRAAAEELWERSSSHLQPWKLSRVLTELTPSRGRPDSLEWVRCGLPPEEFPLGQSLRDLGEGGGLLSARSPCGHQARDADALRVPDVSLLSHTTIYEHFPAAEARLKRMPKRTDTGLSFRTKKERNRHHGASTRASRPHPTGFSASRGAGHPKRHEIGIAYMTQLNWLWFKSPTGTTQTALSRGMGKRTVSPCGWNIIQQVKTMAWGSVSVGINEAQI